MRAALLGLALLAAGCGGSGGEDASGAASAAGNGAAGAVASAAADGALPAVGWVDPEPPDAQARAEAVVGSPANVDKTTRLVMHITTLVDRRTGLEGFASTLAARDVGVDERLDRLGARVSDTEVVIALSGAVLFDFDRDELRPDATRTLEDLLAVLQSYPDRPVRIEGHTDAIASDAYNQALSERRARSVSAWLAARGIPAGRLTARGHGEAKPVADNGTAEGRQRNRRVEVVIERRAR